MDFTDRVMERIANECEAHPVRRSRTKGGLRLTGAVAAIILSLLLLTGFTYAAAVNGWLTIFDSEGRVAMRIIPNQTMEPEAYDQIRESLYGRLEPGEIARLVVGRKSVEQVKRGEMPGVMYHVVKQTAYWDWSEAAIRLSGPLAGVRPPESLLGLKLEKTELIADPRPSDAAAAGKPLLDPSKWIEATDPGTGAAYAYRIESAGEAARTVMLTYSEAAESLVLSITATNGVDNQIIHDDSPSMSEVRRIGGTPVYGMEGTGLAWSERTSDGLLLYHVVSPTGDKTAELAAAEAMIG